MCALFAVDVIAIISYLNPLWMIAGVARNVEHKPVRTKLRGQLPRSVTRVILVTLKAVLDFVWSQLKGICVVIY